MTSPDRRSHEAASPHAAASPRLVARAGPTKVTLERIPYDPAAWGAIVGEHPDAEVYHGVAWLSYLRATQGAEPVIAVVREDGRVVGHFVGGIVRRAGLRILGSPLRGWGTMAMGFLLEPDADRRAAAEALARFAFRELGCIHVELADRRLTRELMAGSGYHAEAGSTFVVDLGRPEDAVFAAMRSTTRNYVRQAARKGLVAERVRDPAFADEYYAQLVEVFARQGLATTYGVERVRSLIAALDPSDEVLLLRVREPGGTSVATIVTIGGNRSAVLWGAAFRRSHADLHPNELMHWEAIRFWRSRGAVRYDMGGAGDYKAKYGGEPAETVHFHRSRWQFLVLGRSLVRYGFRFVQSARGRIRRTPPQPGPGAGLGGEPGTER